MAFKNAKYWSNKDHWQWATEPNNREKASFLKENIIPIQESGHLNFVEKEGNLFDGFSTLFVNGHTEAQMIPHIQYKGKTLVFAADLLPSTGHIPLPYVMGYDTKPLVTLTEKEKFLNDAADNGYVIFLQHDNYNECCTVEHTEKGVRLKDTFKLSDL
jgi:glyoxylase-like metal-dependent hydrolase (beta-lactamase superfamily II)